MTPDELRAKIRNTLSFPVAPSNERYRVLDLLDAMEPGQLGHLWQNCVRWLHYCVQPALDKTLSVEGEAYSASLFALFNALSSNASFVAASQAGTSQSWRALFDTLANAAPCPAYGFSTSLVSPTVATHPAESGLFALLGAALASAAKGDDAGPHLASYFVLTRSVSPQLAGLAGGACRQFLQRARSATGHQSNKDSIAKALVRLIRQEAQGDLCGALVSLSAEVSEQFLDMDARLSVSFIGTFLGIKPTARTSLSGSQLSSVASSALQYGFRAAGIDEPLVRAVSVSILQRSLRNAGLYENAAAVLMGFIGLAATASPTDWRKDMSAGFEEAGITVHMVRSELVIALSELLPLLGRYDAATDLLRAYLTLEDSDLADVAVAAHKLKGGFDKARVRTARDQLALVTSMSERLRAAGNSRAALVVCLGYIKLVSSESDPSGLSPRRVWRLRHLVHRYLKIAVIFIGAKLHAALGVCCSYVELFTNRCNSPDEPSSREWNPYHLSTLPIERVIKFKLAQLRALARLESHQAIIEEIEGMLGLTAVDRSDADAVGNAIHSAFCEGDSKDQLSMVTQSELMLVYARALQSTHEHQQASTVLLSWAGLKLADISSPASARRALNASTQWTSLADPVNRGNFTFSVCLSLLATQHQDQAAGMLEAFVGGPLDAFGGGPPPFLSNIPANLWVELVKLYTGALFPKELTTSHIDRFRSLFRNLMSWIGQEMNRNQEFIDWYSNHNNYAFLRDIVSQYWRFGFMSGFDTEWLAFGEQVENLNVLRKLLAPQEALMHEWGGVDPSWPFDPPSSDDKRLGEWWERCDNGTLSGANRDLASMLRIASSYGKPKAILPEEPGPEDLVRTGDRILSPAALGTLLATYPNYADLLQTDEVLISLRAIRPVNDSVLRFVLRVTDQGQIEQLSEPRIYARGTVDSVNASHTAFLGAIRKSKGQASVQERLQHCDNAVRQFIDRIQAQIPLSDLPAGVVEGRHVLIQADADLQNLPLAMLDIGGGRRLGDAAASVSHVPSCALRRLMQKRAEQLDGTREALDDNRLLYAAWLSDEKNQRDRYLGLPGLHVNLSANLSDWTIDSLGWKSGQEATGKRLSAAVTRKRHRIVVVAGHGHKDSHGVHLASSQPHKHPNGCLWQGAGADFSAVELLVLLSCSVGCVDSRDLMSYKEHRDYRHMPDLLGLYPLLAGHGARNVIAARYPIHNLHAAQLTERIVSEFAGRLARDSCYNHHAAAVAVNDAQSWLIDRGHAGDFYNAAAFAIYE